MINFYSSRYLFTYIVTAQGKRTGYLCWAARGAGIVQKPGNLHVKSHGILYGAAVAHCGHHRQPGARDELGKGLKMRAGIELFIFTTSNDDRQMDALERSGIKIGFGAVKFY